MDGYFEGLVRQITRETAEPNKEITRKRAKEIYRKFRNASIEVMKNNPGIILSELQLGSDRDGFHIYFHINGDPKLIEVKR